MKYGDIKRSVGNDHNSRPNVDELDTPKLELQLTVRFVLSSTLKSDYRALSMISSHFVESKDNLVKILLNSLQYCCK